LAQLATLAGFYSGGSSELLPFFPETALAFARALAKGEEAAWGAAAKVWTDERARDAYFSLAFRDVNPLDAKFAAHARSVCGPMLAAEIDDA
jgi:hypothetical protein